MPIVPQRTVSLFIDTSGLTPKVLYTYVSPQTGKLHKNVKVCDLIIDSPTYCLFYLDYASTEKGWKIDEIKRAKGSLKIDWKLGPHDLSIMTDYPFTAPSPTFNFFICYENADGTGFCEDPQEGNGPP